MSQRIVINGCHGGATLSLKGIERMIELGHDYVRRYKAEFDEAHRDDELMRGYYSLHCMDELKRDDPILVQVVDELGPEASHQIGKLYVVDIPDGVNWTIEEYDGWEWIAETHRRWS